MPEKQTQGFGQIEKGEMFALAQDQKDSSQVQADGSQIQAAGTQAQASESPAKTGLDKRIVLNITASQGGKLHLLKKNVYVRLTGNPLIDAYTRVNDFFIDHTKVKVREKATFFRLLAVMINSGLSLIKSLNTLAFQVQKNKRFSKILYETARAIEGGQSLSKAMENFPELFNEAQTGMIRAGEASGQLNKTLKDLAEEMEKTASITGKVKGALIYPIAILVLLVLVIFVMMVAVVPPLTKLFTQTGRELPLPTQILMAMSDFCVNFWPLIAVGVFGLISGISFWKKTQSGKAMWDYFMLKVPIFGTIIQKSLLSKFARSFSNLLSSGVPIIRSLEIVANAIGNEVYKKQIFLTAEDMRSGIPMAESLADNKLFPPMLVNMIEIGEQTAQIENVTLKVAEFYDEEVDNVVKGLTKIMEPLIILIIGVTVGGLVSAIMLPIIQLTNFTSGI